MITPININNGAIIQNDNQALILETLHGVFNVQDPRSDNSLGNTVLKIIAVVAIIFTIATVFFKNHANINTKKNISIQTPTKISSEEGSSTDEEISSNEESGKAYDKEWKNKKKLERKIYNELSAPDDINKFNNLMDLYIQLVALGRNHELRKELEAPLLKVIDKIEYVLKA